jgi:Tfp pilus assembly protein PilN
MSDIDFLPATYRQMTVHRKANVWRLAAGGLFVAMIGFSGIYQHMLRRGALSDLARTNAGYDRASALIAKQGELKKQLQLTDCDAQLFTYLRHPWPATQLFAAALGKLPDCITLDEIRLYYGEPRASIATAAASKSADKKSSEAASAFERDLQRLREDYDTRDRILVLSGATRDTAALQQFLVSLSHCGLFQKTELGSLEADAADHSGAIRFTARLFVCPGYGQPGGPLVKHSPTPIATLDATRARKTVRANQTIGPKPVSLHAPASTDHIARNNEDSP